MAEDKDLEQFKEEFTKGYIDPHIDHLLDLRNVIKYATSYDDVRAAITQERASIVRELGLEEVKPEDIKHIIEVKSEGEQKHTNTHET